MLSKKIKPRPLIRLGYTGAPALLQLGVMRAVDDVGVVPHVVATGLGALVGALWACNTDLRRAASVLAHLPWAQVATDFAGWVGLLVRGRKIEELSRELTIVTLDIRSGQKQAIRTGPLAEAVRKAVSLPGWIAPFQDQNRLWADAGALTPHALKQVGIRTNGRWLGMVPMQSAGDVDEPLEAASVRLANAWHSEMVATGIWMPGADFIRPVGPFDFHAIEVSALQVYRQAGVWLQDVYRF